jgi:hypothetical protein
MAAPLSSQAGHHSIAFGDELLDADLERVERRQLLAARPAAR